RAERRDEPATAPASDADAREEGESEVRNHRPARRDPDAPEELDELEEGAVERQVEAERPDEADREERAADPDGVREPERAQRRDEVRLARESERARVREAPADGDQHRQDQESASRVRRAQELTAEER